MRFLSGTYLLFVHLCLTAIASDRIIANPLQLTAVAFVRPGEKGLNIQHLELADVWTTQQVESAFDDIVAMGVRWIRVGVSWEWVQPERATSWNFAFPDLIVREARSRGIKLLVQLNTPVPTWAASYNGDKLALPLTEVNSFANFAGMMAKRYAPIGVHHWEIFNEVNGRYLAADYAPLLRVAHTRIHEADVTATVLTAGLMTSDSTKLEGPIEFIHNLYQLGYGADFDGIAMHPYTWTTPLNRPGTNWSQMAESVPSVRSVMIQNGDINKKIWITEIGFPTWSPDNGFMNESSQVRWINEVYQLIRHCSWAGPVFWYSYRDNGIGHATAENFYGLIRFHLSKKPGYYAYSKVPPE